MLPISNTAEHIRLADGIDHRAQRQSVIHTPDELESLLGAGSVRALEIEELAVLFVVFVVDVIGAVIVIVVIALG